MDPQQKTIALGSLLLANCPKPVAETLLQRSVVQRHPRGHLLFNHGDPARFTYIVLDGWIKLIRITPNGSEAVVGVFTRGSSFGEAAALRGEAYPVTCEAATDCEVVQIPSAEILTVMRRHPEVCIAILSSTFAHLHALVRQVEQLKAHSGAQRVAQFLVSLARCDEGPCTITLPFDKVLIAGRLGMKPESLSRTFARLKEQGVTIRQSHADIRDVAELRAFADSDGSGEVRQAYLSRHPAR